MEGSRLGNLITRAFLILCAAVVLGLSASLAKEWTTYDKYCGLYTKSGDRNTCRSYEGRWPSSTDFAAFVGAFGLLDALVGLVAVFFTALPALVVMVFDGLAAVFYLAGGVNLAVLYHSNFISQYYFEGSKYGTRYVADIAFMFLGLIGAIICLVLTFLSGRSAGGSKRTAGHV